MFKLFRRTSASAAFLVINMTVAAINPIASAQTTPNDTQNQNQNQIQIQNQTPTDTQNQTPTQSTTSFRDVSSSYWATPFIQALAQRNVISGFTDGTFKPDQPVKRAEFAAMIEKAFNQNSVRQLSGSGFRDVPANYWASGAIKEAYESGFMSGYPNNLFYPNQQIPKVQAIVALTNGLGLNNSDTTANVLSTYYSDAADIPGYAVNSVAAATQANLVVNYPELKVLNPRVSLTRAEAAALLYQALVKQGQLPALASNTSAANYIVAGNASGRQTGTTDTTNTTAAATTTSSDIVTYASSSSSFTTLTSALKAAGLTETLQGKGPYTVFAPTDAAFAAIPPETLQKLLQPQNRETLRRILRYHVVNGEITSPGEVRTLADKSVNVQVDRTTNQIAVNNATVVQPIQTSNGVIYAINQVLLPPDLNLSQLPQPGNGGVSPGRATRGGSSYVGVAGNIGLGGDSALSEPNFAVISKLGLTRNISVRPSAVIGDDTVILVPLTLDFAPRAASPLGTRTFAISPYIGAGVAIETSNDANIGLLLTGGVDLPIGTRFTVNGAVNAAFLQQTDVGLMFGLGYNF